MLGCCRNAEAQRHAASSPGYEVRLICRKTSRTRLSAFVESEEDQCFCGLRSRTTYFDCFLAHVVLLKCKEAPRWGPRVGCNTRHLTRQPTRYRNVVSRFSNTHARSFGTWGM